MRGKKRAEAGRCGVIRPRAAMLSHCANPKCAKPFLRLREGKLFLVETDRIPKTGGAATTVRKRTPQRHLERYWLCEDCASHWTLVCDKDQGVALAPLKRPAVTAVQSSATQTCAAQNGAALETCRMLNRQKTAFSRHSSVISQKAVSQKADPVNT
jgi:hypothetical protein